MLAIAERSARDQAKIRNEFLVLSSPGRGPLLAAVGLHGNAAEVRLLRRASDKRS